MTPLHARTSRLSERRLCRLAISLLRTLALFIYGGKLFQPPRSITEPCLDTVMGEMRILTCHRRIHDNVGIQYDYAHKPLAHVHVPDFVLHNITSAL